MTYKLARIGESCESGANSIQAIAGVYRISFRDISRMQLEQAARSLGPDGCGVLKLSGFLDESFRTELIQEIENESKISWTDKGDSYVNNRGVLIAQNHETFAVKLSQGDSGYVDEVPLMGRLAHDTQSFVRSFGRVFPALSGWTADEMTYHRYCDRDVGLSYHRENIRFVGVIAVVSVIGECDFGVIKREPISYSFDEDFNREVVDEWLVHDERVITTSPGDVILTRATNLYPGMKDEDRPEHAVMNIGDLPRLSFIARDNARPHDPIGNFDYINWP